MRHPLAMGLLVLVVGGLVLAASWGVAGSAETCPALAFRDRLFDVSFSTGQDAWAVGYPGLLLHSTDGGVTWSRPCDLTPQAFFAVDFPDPQHGWVVGRSGFLLSSDDAGQTWKEHEALCTEALFDVDFPDVQHGYIVGNFGRLARTSDGGQTWQVDVVEPMSNASINVGYFFDAQHGIIGGEYPIWEAQLDEEVSVSTLSNMFTTHDGGVTWELVNTPSKLTVYDIYFQDEMNGWVVGAKGMLMATTDGGVTWQVIPTPVNCHLLKIAKGTDALWIAGTEGTLLRFKGGVAELVPLPAYSWLSAVAFSSTGKGVVVGGRGALFSTADNGATWQEFSINP